MRYLDDHPHIIRYRPPDRNEECLILRIPDSWWLSRRSLLTMRLSLLWFLIRLWWKGIV